jgi:hypothetical protein
MYKLVLWGGNRKQGGNDFATIFVSNVLKTSFASTSLVEGDGYDQPCRLNQDSKPADPKLPYG